MVLEMSGQYWDIVHRDSNLMDGTAANTICRYAFYVPSSNVAGMNSLANLGFAITATPSAGALPNGTAGHSILRYQVFVDGKPWVDFVQPLATNDPDAVGPSNFDYYIQTAGGTVIQLARDNEAALNYVQYLPLGIPLTNSEQRIEVVVEFDLWDGAAGYWNAGVTTDSFVMNILAMYGTSNASLSIGSATTYTASANATESVVVRGDAGRGQMAGCVIFNDTQADEWGADGFRAQLGGNYSMNVDIHSILNGDASGTGALHVPDITDVTRSVGSTAFMGLLGATFLNTYNLTAGSNLTIVQQSTAATTRFYYPVYIKPLGQPAQAIPKMTVTRKPDATSTIADDAGQS